MGRQWFYSADTHNSVDMVIAVNGILVFAFELKNHTPIIAPDVFNNVQILMKARCPGRNCDSCVSVFSSKIKCGDCGSWYSSKVWHSNDK